MATKTFAEILSEAMDARGWTPGELAAKLKQRGSKIDRGTIRRWQNGEHHPDIKKQKVLRDIPNALGMSPAEKASFLEAASQALDFPITPVTQDRSGYSATAVIPQRFHFGADSLPPFAGRSKELAELEDSIRKNQSVVITGLGGIGKTRLAQQLLQNSVRHFAHGCEYLEIVPK